MREDPRAKRMTGAYDEPYASPGQYSSPRQAPSTERDEPPPRRRKFTRFSSPTPERDAQHAGRSLLSMVGDEYVDANVAANEKEVRSCKPPIKADQSAHSALAQGQTRVNNSCCSFQEMFDRSRANSGSSNRQRKQEKSRRYRDANRLREERLERRREERKREPCRKYQAGHCTRVSEKNERLT